MNDGERELEGVSAAEAELASRLARLGPVMQEQERAESELDRRFAATLRSHLVEGEERAPHPRFARTLRARLLAQPAARPLHRRRSVWIGSAAATALALLIAVVVGFLVPRGAHPARFAAPVPARADLLFALPAPAISAAALSPTTSLVRPRPAHLYRGHLRLTSPPLPRTPPSFAAYRLSSPLNVVGTGRLLLGIRSPVRQMVTGSALWSVAADGGVGERPLHSLAVSLTTGELIYHDRRNLALPRARRALPASAAVAVARRWLSQLGWPGGRMPLGDVERVPGMPKVREVELGWIGVGTAATDAATLWVTPDRSVIEAWVWPPVARTGSVPSHPLSAAWRALRSGLLPLVVEAVSPALRETGTGAVRHITLLSILSFRIQHAVYLVPAYSFRGIAHIPGTGIRSWYSVAPAGH
jgi:hypothetical protein